MVELDRIHTNYSRAMRLTPFRILPSPNPRGGLGFSEVSTLQTQATSQAASEKLSPRLCLISDFQKLAKDNLFINHFWTEQFIDYQCECVTQMLKCAELWCKANYNCSNKNSSLKAPYRSDTSHVTQMFWTFVNCGGSASIGTLAGCKNSVLDKLKEYLVLAQNRVK
ncbi:hypothetical protein CR513_47394, partial [Mucuna pruriens]